MCSLKRDELLKEVARHIVTCKPPQVLGVYGGWGSGKTSFLRQLQYAFSGYSDLPNPATDPTGRLRALKAIATERYPTVWFEAWRYQHEAKPIVALLHEIRAQLAPGTKFWSTFAKRKRQAQEAGLATVGAITNEIGLGNVTDNLRQAGERYDASVLATPLSTAKVTDLLNHAVGQLIGVGKRLVIFIDDLDRCEAENAIRLLEGIKVYLTLERCVFVFGINREAMADAWRTSRRDKQPDAECHFGWRAKEYLEKICQNSWNLTMPVAGKPDIQQWVLATHTQPEAQQEMAIDVCDHIDRMNLPMNPRRIKSFANLIGRYLNRVEVAGIIDEDNDLPKTIALLAYIEHYHPWLMQFLVIHEDFYDKQLRPWCRGEVVARMSARKMRLPTETKLPSAESVEQRAEIEAERGPSFYDMAHEEVFHAQELVSELELSVALVKEFYL